MYAIKFQPFWTRFYRPNERFKCLFQNHNYTNKKVGLRHQQNVSRQKLASVSTRSYKLVALVKSGQMGLTGIIKYFSHIHELHRLEGGSQACLKIVQVTRKFMLRSLRFHRYVEHQFTQLDAHYPHSVQLVPRKSCQACCLLYVVTVA